MNTRNVRFARICRSNIVVDLLKNTPLVIFTLNSHRELT